MPAPRLARVYRGLALLAWNSFLVLVAMNLVALLLLALGVAAPPAPGSLRYGLERLAKVHPERDGEEIDELLRETWTREYVYAPWVQHMEGPMQGRWVNVDPAGFRLSAAQGPWPPAAEELAVFVYGGSTTFGYGVADTETVPSALQQALGRHGCDRPVRVYNFGRGNYYSEQERVLFASHLAEEYLPAAAVFLDGLNEWKDSPKFTARLEYLMREPRARLWRRALKTLPLTQLLRRVRDRLSAAEVKPQREDASAYGRKIVERWLSNRRLIAAMGEAFGVRTVFVWQPVPTYQYDLEHHLFRQESAAAFSRHGPLQQGYALLDSLRSESPELSSEAGFLWLADLQLGRREPLYVDAAHYTAAFSRLIAERIAAHLAPIIGCGAAPAGSDQPE